MGRQLARIATAFGRPLSLKARLVAGALVLTLGTVLTAATLLLGMAQVGARMDAALKAEARMARYGTLSAQVSTFLVVATEAVQSGLAPEVRAGRLAPVVSQLRATFELIGQDLEIAVADMERLGLDAQTRYATQGLGVARMEATLEQALRGLTTQGADRAVLRAHIDSFANSIDPLLNAAVNGESLFRRATLAGIAELRQRFAVVAVVMAGLSLLAALAVTLGVVRPLFRRLDLLQGAARRMGAGDFGAELPEDRLDEVGRLFAETNAAARALAQREADVTRDRARLNDIVEDRTEALRSANARLEAVDDSRKRLFADISHELRTPLTVILMEAQLGRQTLPEAAEVFATIETRAARLNRRIDDLLRLSRSDSGALALSPEMISVANVLRAVAEEVAAECASAGMEMDVTPPAKDLQVMADPNWLRQVLAGLVRNAIRHARSGGLVRLAARRNGASVVLEVADRGPGIAPELQPQLFDRFAQGGAQGVAREGFGLGLALARWVIEAHDGEIGVISPSEPPQGASPCGTIVRISLPVVAA